MYSDLTPQSSMWEDSVGTLTEHRACGLGHLISYILLVSRYVSCICIYLFREFCLRVGMFLCVFILLLDFFSVTIFICPILSFFFFLMCNFIATLLCG